MKKNKGFTLVELLGVITVLAIIILITIPIVIKIIENANIEGEKKSIIGYARTIENDLSSYLMMNPSKNYSDYNISNNLEYKGNTVICESENVNDNGKVTLLNCYVTPKKRNQITDIVEEGKNRNRYDYVDGKVIKISSDNNNNNNNNNDNNDNNNNNEQSSITYEEYVVGDRIQIAGEESGDYYYVIAASDLNQDYVVALKENPLTVSEVNTYRTWHINQYTSSSQGTAYNYNGYGGMAYYSSSTCGYVNGSWVHDGCTNSYNASEVKYVVDGWAAARFTNSELKTVDGYAARLISYGELTGNLGYAASTEATPSSNGETPTWLYNSQYEYWTLSQYENFDSRVWTVSNDGTLAYNSVYYVYGVVRPVINLYKSKIERR